MIQNINLRSDWSFSNDTVHLITWIAYIDDFTNLGISVEIFDKAWQGLAPDLRLTSQSMEMEIK